MKKKKFILFSALSLSIGLSLFSCAEKVQIDEESAEVLRQKVGLFVLASQSGYEGTYEQWLESIKGDAIVLNFIDGKIMWKYTLDDDNSWMVLINLEDYVGNDKNIINLKASIETTNGVITTLQDELQSKIETENKKLEERLGILDNKYDEEVSDLESQVNSVNEKLSILNTKYEDDLSKLQQSIKENNDILEALNIKYLEDLDNIEKEFDENDEKLQEAIDELSTKHNEDISSINKNIADTNSAIATLENRYASDKKALEDAIALTNSSISTLETKHNEDIKKIQDDSKEAIEDLEALIDDAISTINCSINEAVKKIASNEEAIVELQVGLEDVNDLLTSYSEQHEKDKNELLGLISELQNSIDNLEKKHQEEIAILEEMINQLSEIKSYTVKLNPNNGETPWTIIINEQQKIAKPSNPTKDGYTFVGWYTKDDEKWIFSGYTVTSDMELVARYKSNEQQDSSSEQEISPDDSVSEAISEETSSEINSHEEQSSEMTSLEVSQSEEISSSEQIIVSPVAGTFTFAANDFGGLGKSGGGKSGTITKDNITITGSNCYGSGDDFRIYNGAKITFSSTASITKIVINCVSSGSYNAGGFAVIDGASKNNTTTYTWNGNKNELSITASSHQVRILSIEITLE